MAFHHVAIATRDIKATHEFYTGPMGFELVKAVANETPEKGWAKHLFYDTGNGELIAFWDLHGPGVPADWSASISTGLGLPEWANHVAFGASDRDDIDTRRRRWLEHGHDVVEIDHGWCWSIYTRDPNGILVEFCTTTAEFSLEDREQAARLLADPHPEYSDEGGAIQVHRARDHRP